MVTEKMVEPGNMASPGMPLLRLEDTRGFRLEVRVDESRIGQIRNGDSVPVFLGTGTTSIEGTVVEVSRAVDAMRARFSSRSRCPMHLAFDPANSARRDLAGRRDAR
jgi:multidrug resistance efflux pump